MQYLKKKGLWVTSDTHFNHHNILNFQGGRGDDFSSIEEMNETLIERWNSVVKAGDKVYHLGDVFMSDRDWFKKNWPRLNGQKRLLVGNHDDVKFLSSGGFFKKVQLWRMFPEYEVVLTHVPIKLEESHRKYNKNIHGHVHRNSLEDPRYTNVCVENTNYTPVDLWELMEGLNGS